MLITTVVPYVDNAAVVAYVDNVTVVTYVDNVCRLQCGGCIVVGSHCSGL